VLDMVERLCVLVPEWIQVVDPEKRKRKVGDGPRKYSKDAAIVLSQDVHYCTVRDTILAGGNGRGGVTKIRGSLERKYGGNSILSGERKVTPWNQRLNVDVRKDDQRRIIANRQQEKKDTLSSPLHTETRIVPKEKDPVVTPESPSSMFGESNCGETPSKIICEDEHDDVDKDYDLSDKRNTDQMAPSTPTPSLSALPAAITEVSPTSTDIATKQSRSKLKLGMTLRRRQKRIISSPTSRRKAAIAQEESPAAPITPRKSSSIGRYFSTNKRGNLGKDLDHDDDNNDSDNESSPLVVDEDEDLPSSSLSENKQLRVNHTLHLTDEDMDGGLFIDPSGTTCPRGLKRLFDLLNNGERI